MILNSSHKILCGSSIMIIKASIYTMNALNKLSELWHTSVNGKARPVVEGEHDKSWNDHDMNHTLKKIKISIAPGPNFASKNS